MYRFLDRPVWQLEEPHRFLLAAMRGWVARARRGLCPCAGLRSGFASRGVAEALPHFSTAMAALDQDGLGTMRFGLPEGFEVTDDEARVLVLFDAALRDEAIVLRRAAHTLVRSDAATIIADAALYVAGYLSQGTAA